VLLFTHHERVAAQAQSVLDPSRVKILRLPNTSAPQAGQATISATGA
jgi:hypothetical protein